MSFQHNSSLQSHLLLAMPNMGDPRFHRAVVFICVHDEKGAMGITINDPMPSPDFESLLNQLGIAGENMTIPSIPVCAGGPVETGRGFLLHSDDFHEKDTIVVDDNFAISGTIDSLRKIVERRAPRHMIFALGYAGWGAGQLERELHDNAWLSVPATTELVFGTRPDLMWEYAYSSIGINPMLLSGTAGRA